MTFNDIFKSSFLEKAAEFSVLDVVIAMLMSFAIGLFIFYVYKKTFAGVMYSASFGVSIMAMTLITTLIILAVTSNIVLSLGMVGALSIVRFRTAVKEPLNIAFLFWAISAGIVIGAGLIPLGIIGSVFIGIILLVFVNRKSKDTPYILVINFDNDEAENDCMAVIMAKTKKSLIKAKTVSKSSIELTVEVRLLDMSAKLLIELLTYSIVFEHSENAYVIADEAKITQALYNLLINAVNYSTDDKHIIVRQNREQNSVRVEVCDFGDGISPENIPDIWDRYYKVDKKHKRAITGTGLGLSIVKKVFELHGVGYGVKSEFGKGSVFWFRLEMIKI